MLNVFMINYKQLKDISPYWQMVHKSIDLICLAKITILVYFEF